MDIDDLLNAQTPAELRNARLAENEPKPEPERTAMPERLFVHEVRRGKGGQWQLVVDFSPR